MKSLRERAMELAVDYCRQNYMYDLIETAEKIYQFLLKDQQPTEREQHDK